jgi:hypothetical protein
VRVVAPSLATSLESEAARARVSRGNEVRPDLSAREQRYAIEVSKRTTWTPSRVLGFLRHMRPRYRPCARRVLAACAAYNLDPEDALTVLRRPTAALEFVRAVETAVGRGRCE